MRDAALSDFGGGPTNHSAVTVGGVLARAAGKVLASAVGAVLASAQDLRENTPPKTLLREESNCALLFGPRPRSALASDRIFE